MGNSQSKEIILLLILGNLFLSACARETSPGKKEENDRNKGRNMHSVQGGLPPGYDFNLPKRTESISVYVKPAAVYSVKNHSYPATATVTNYSDETQIFYKTGVVSATVLMKNSARGKSYGKMSERRKSGTKVPPGKSVSFNMDLKPYLLELKAGKDGKLQIGRYMVIFVFWTSGEHASSNAFEVTLIE